MRSGLDNAPSLVYVGSLVLICLLLLNSLSIGQSTDPVLADGRTQAPSPLSTFDSGPELPEYFSKTIHPNQFVTHEIDLGEVLNAYASDHKCSLNEAFDALAKKLQMIPRDLVDLKQPTPGTTTLRRPDAINSNPQAELLRNAIFQVVKKDVYSITARQLFFNALPINLHSFQYGDDQIVIEVRYVTVPAKDVVKLQSFMIPNTFEAFENQLPQVAPMATFASAKSEKTKTSGDVPTSGTFVSASETKTRAYPTFMGHLNSKGMKALVNYCKGHVETELVQAPTLTVFSGSRGTVSDGALQPFVVSVKRVKVGTRVEHQPIIQMVENGIKLSLEAESKAGNIQIAGDVFFSKVLSVDTFEYPYAANQDGNKVNIQIPEHQVRRVHWSTSIESGNTLLIDPVETLVKEIKPKTRFKKAVHESMRRLILVTPRQIKDQE